MRIEAIASGKNPPDDVNVIIEVPIGGEPIKYEMDKEAGTLFVDRFLHTSMMTLGSSGGFFPVAIASIRMIFPLSISEIDSGRSGMVQCGEWCSGAGGRLSGRHSQTKATFFSAFCSKISTPSATSRPPTPA